MAVPPQESELHELSVKECWQLAETRSVGRFAACRFGAGPLVVPVNYVIAADRSIVVFRSGPGAKLKAVGQGIAVIEVDEIDPLHRTGWSVIIEGTTSWHFEGSESTDIETWAPGPKPYVVRMVPTGITGRRIHLPQPDTDERGYR